MIHVAGKTGDRHDEQSQAGRPRAQGSPDKIESIEPDQPGGLFGRKNLAGAEQACCWKLDVEGFEQQVLDGAASLLAQQALKVVLLEDRSSAVVERMLAAGFRSFSYNPWTRLLSTDQDSLGGNQSWIRDGAWAADRLRTAPPFRVTGIDI